MEEGGWRGSIWRVIYKLGEAEFGCSCREEVCCQFINISNGLGHVN